MTCNHIPSVTCPECAGAERDKFYVYQPTCQSCRMFVSEVARLTRERDEARRAGDKIRAGVAEAWQRYVTATEGMIEALRPGTFSWQEKTK